MNKQKQLAKSRLQQHKTHKNINKAVVISGFITLALWSLNFVLLIKGEQNFHTVEIPKTIFTKQVQAKETAKEDYTPSGRAIKLINANPDLSSKIKNTFGDSWRYAAELITRESSFNKYAINPSSGACGLAQALPCSKMKCDLSDEQCQLNWIKNYVNERYGGVKQAVEFHDRNNWY